MTGRLPILPVLLARRGVDRAVDGHRVLVDRVTAWVASETAGAEERRGAIATRGGMLLGGAWVGWQLGPATLAVATPAWLAAAWWHGPATEPDAEVEQAEAERDEEEPPAPPAPPTPEDVAHDVDVLRRLIGDQPGIHLDALAAAVGLDHEQLRAWLNRLGVPVRRSVRIGGKHGRVRTGIHRDDLPDPAPRPETGPSPEGVEPAQSALHPHREGPEPRPGERTYAIDDEPVWPGTTPARQTTARG
ncbi:hypothetical protein [Embleya sp. NPDC005971]|uniref:hypothetical protein n=1 Tax=Embleya sp. NPDC005971 TaxID=3156724 RepID=UPI0033F92F5A